MSSAVAWIGLGGNVGDVPSTFARALHQLRDASSTLACQSSGLYRSAPMGVDAGAAYWNAVIRLITTAAPDELLRLLQEIETACGRVRSLHWGPRTLDLDILAYGDVVIRSARLTIPHPGRIYRRFVLDPWCEVDPDWRDAETGLTVTAMRQRLLTQPPTVALLGWTPEKMQTLSQLVQHSLPANAVVTSDLHIASQSGLIVAPSGSACPPGLPRVVLDQPANLSDLASQIRVMIGAAFDVPERVMPPPQNPDEGTRTGRAD